MTARVLVVDDISANVRLLEAKLLIEYYEVLTANDGPTALDLVRTQGPDIVLLDVMMPGMDGFEVCRRIKSDPETTHIPVVMVTALSEVKDRVEGLEAGADDFLTKPVNDVALFARIRSLVRLKRAWDEWRTRESTLLQFGGTARDGDGDKEGGRILLAMDAVDSREKIRGTLADRGHAVTAIATVADALATAKSESFDVVLCDDRLEGQDALRMCSQLRTNDRTRHWPVLLIIEDGDNERLAKALELGVTDYLMRPVERDELIARVRSQIQRKRYEDRLRERYEQSLAAAVTDSLTGLNNRRYLDAHFDAVNQRLAGTNKSMSVLLIDIDHFKQVNDTLGHAVGDEVLEVVAGRIQTNLRGFDTAVRYGGEEFVILMPNATLSEATAAGERLCYAVAHAPIRVSAPENELSVTVSIGVASAIAGECTLDDIVREADRAMYEAKNSGRNRVVAAKPPGAGPAGAPPLQMKAANC